jgi:ribosomal protein L11 methyltransferase
VLECAAGEDVEERLAAWLSASEALGAELLEAGSGLGVRAYLPGSLTEPTAREHAASLAASLGLQGAALLSWLADAGWAEAYRRTLRPFPAGRRLWIVPTEPGPDAEPVPPEGRLPIFLPPGRAFGTGDHPTTLLCLAYLERQLQPGSSLLDVGSGSGILAIAGIRLGAARAVAVEPDREAAAELARNVRRNGVGRRIEIVAGPLREVAAGWFDLATANILARTLSELLPEIAFLLRPGGGAVLSGIRDEEAAGLADEAAGRRLHLVGSERAGGWTALHLRKPEVSPP